MMFIEVYDQESGSTCFINPVQIVYLKPGFLLNRMEIKMADGKKYDYYGTTEELAKKIGGESE